MLNEKLNFFSTLRPLPSTIQLWQARRDSNPHHPDLESGALSVRATGLYPVSGE
jgi:hypothetical protein